MARTLKPVNAGLMTCRCFFQNAPSDTTKPLPIMGDKAMLYTSDKTRTPTRHGHRSMFSDREQMLNLVWQRRKHTLEKTAQTWFDIQPGLATEYILQINRVQANETRERTETCGIQLAICPSVVSGKFIERRRFPFTIGNEIGNVAKHWFEGHTAKIFARHTRTYMWVYSCAPWRLMSHRALI
jgi:hypothetical protein